MTTMTRTTTADSNKKRQERDDCMISSSSCYFPVVKKQRTLSIDEQWQGCLETLLARFGLDGDDEQVVAQHMLGTLLLALDQHQEQQSGKGIERHASKTKNVLKKLYQGKLSKSIFRLLWFAVKQVVFQQTQQQQQTQNLKTKDNKDATIINTRNKQLPAPISSSSSSSSLSSSSPPPMMVEQTTRTLLKVEKRDSWPAHLDRIPRNDEGGDDDDDDNNNNGDAEHDDDQETNGCEEEDDGAGGGQTVVMLPTAKSTEINSSSEAEDQYVKRCQSKETEKRPRYSKQTRQAPNPVVAAKERNPETKTNKKGSKDDLSSSCRTTVALPPLCPPISCNTKPRGRYLPLRRQRQQVSWLVLPKCPKQWDLRQINTATTVQGITTIAATTTTTTTTTPCNFAFTKHRVSKILLSLEKELGLFGTSCSDHACPPLDSSFGERQRQGQASVSSSSSASTVMECLVDLDGVFSASVVKYGEDRDEVRQIRKLVRDRCGVGTISSLLYYHACGGGSSADSNNSKNNKNRNKNNNACHSDSPQEKQQQQQQHEKELILVFGIMILQDLAYDTGVEVHIALEGGMETSLRAIRDFSGNASICFRAYNLLLNLLVVESTKEADQIVQHFWRLPKRDEYLDALCSSFEHWLHKSNSDGVNDDELARAQMFKLLDPACLLWQKLVLHDTGSNHHEHRQCLLDKGVLALLSRAEQLCRHRLQETQQQPHRILLSKGCTDDNDVGNLDDMLQEIRQAIYALVMTAGWNEEKANVEIPSHDDDDDDDKNNRVEANTKG